MNRSIIAGIFVALSLIFSGPLTAQAATGTQKPFDAAELEKFITDYGPMTQWQAKDGASVGDLKHPWVMAGMQYNVEFGESLKEKGWDVERFFYMLNHVRQGMLQERNRLWQEHAEARLNNHMAKMAAKSQSQRAAYEKKRQEQAKQAQDWLNDQLAAQKKRVIDNPYMHPMQKQTIMEFLNRSSVEASRVTNNNFDFAEAKARAEAQRKEWEASYRRSIQNNPMIPVEQKKLILEGMDKANQPMEKAEPAPMPSQEEMMARMKEQRQQWIAKQVAQVQNNPNLSEERKQKMIKRFNSFTQLVSGVAKNQQVGSLPEEESELIGKNLSRLVKLLHRK